jgi:hypothetical protein
MNNIPKPIPSYTEKLIESDEDLILNGLPKIDENLEYYTELEYAIEENLKDNGIDKELKYAIEESIKDNNQYINNILYKSLLEYEILENNIKELDKIKKERLNKLDKFISYLIRINNLINNTTIKLLIKILESFIENSITTYLVTVDIHNKIFNELKTVRITPEIYDIINSIIIIDNLNDNQFDV